MNSKGIEAQASILLSFVRRSIASETPQDAHAHCADYQAAERRAQGVAEVEPCLQRIESPAHDWVS